MPEKQGGRCQRSPRPARLAWYSHGYTARSPVPVGEDVTPSLCWLNVTSPRATPTKLYDRTSDQITLDNVDRITI
jgi:hypothetical protein